MLVVPFKHPPITFIGVLNKHKFNLDSFQNKIMENITWPRLFSCINHWWILTCLSTLYLSHACGTSQVCLLITINCSLERLAILFNVTKHFFRAIFLLFIGAIIVKTHLQNSDPKFCLNYNLFLNYIIFPWWTEE